MSPIPSMETLEGESWRGFIDALLQRLSEELKKNTELSPEISNWELSVKKAPPKNITEARAIEYSQLNVISRVFGELERIAKADSFREQYIVSASDEVVELSDRDKADMVKDVIQDLERVKKVFSRASDDTLIDVDNVESVGVKNSKELHQIFHLLQKAGHT